VDDWTGFYHTADTKFGIDPNSGGERSSSMASRSILERKGKKSATYVTLGPVSFECESQEEDFFTKADQHLVTGKLEYLWLSDVRFSERLGDIDRERSVTMIVTMIEKRKTLWRVSIVNPTVFVAADRIHPAGDRAFEKSSTRMFIGPISYYDRVG
jgi:hypothetical protein